MGLIIRGVIRGHDKEEECSHRVLTECRNRHLVLPYTIVGIYGLLRVSDVTSHKLEGPFGTHYINICFF